MVKKFETDFGGKPLIVETGLAPQANAALKLSYGETVVLVTAVMNEKSKEGANFLPLTVEYEEKFYAAGKIKGSRFVKREGRASDEAVLTGRMIDRIIRPRFDQKIRNDIQVVVTVFSFDNINDPDIPAVIGASLVLGISDIPWRGPLSVARIGKTEDKFVLNPSYEEREKSLFDFTVASDGTLINMIELGAKGVKNQDIMEAVSFAKAEIKKNIVFQEKIIQELKQAKKMPHLAELDTKLAQKAKDFLAKHLSEVLGPSIKSDFEKNLAIIEQDLFLSFSKEIKQSEEPARLQDALRVFFENEIDKTVHKNILTKTARPDGRKLDEIRKLSCEVGILPRTHGSAIFMRGLTHVLSTVTLAGPAEEQLLDGMEVAGSKRFMHHYNFPPYSVGETGFFRGPGRREIGHGALAEKAIKPILPNKEVFPYTIRIVSEVLSSNGSSSMASACGSALALLDAGVPIKSSISGIAMGLMMGETQKDYKILTDIQGPEDHYGDMDLKVAGTKETVTAMQMDVKIEGITEEILEKSLDQAQKARQKILEVMDKTISHPRADLSLHAPRIVVLKVEKDKIGAIIGGGGKVINGIIEKTNTAIDIQNDGSVYVSGETMEAVEAAVKIINGIVKEFETGEVSDGVVSRLLDFGAFVKLTPNHEGLIHISKLAAYHVNNVQDIVLEGDKVKVEVVNIDELGRINLKLLQNFSRKPNLNSSPTPQKTWQDRKPERGNFPSRRPRNRF